MCYGERVCIEMWCEVGGMVQTSRFGEEVGDLKEFTKSSGFR